MEIENVRRVKNDTRFNVNITKQWIPYWNGLLHVIGTLEDGVIVRRYDWDRVIADCEAFEAAYMNTSGFCESCVFSQIPPFLQSRLAQKPASMDCKTFAQDNDIVYHYCIEQTEKYTHSISILAIVCAVVAGLCVLALIVYLILFRR